MPELDWLTAQQTVDEWDQRDGSRRAEHVEFVLGIPEAAYEWTPGTSESDVVATAADREGQAVADSVADLVPPTQLRWHATGVGRGAEGDAVGIILAVSGITGGVLAAIELAERVAAVWRRLRKRKPRPTLSLGAAKLLCIADLSTRVPHSELGDVVVAAAADIGPARSSELGHTGGDLFTIVLASATRTYVYVIDSEGGVVHFGTGNALSASVALYAGVPVDDDAWDRSPPRLLEDDSDRSGQASADEADT